MLVVDGRDVQDVVILFGGGQLRTILVEGRLVVGSGWMAALHCLAVLLLILLLLI